MVNFKLGLVLLFLLLSISVVYGEVENMDIGGLNFEIPEQYQGGNYTNVKLGVDVYTKFIGENFFRIFVYRDTTNIDSYVGYMIENSDSGEYKSIDGRTVLFLKQTKPYIKTVIIFESQGRLVTVEIPSSSDLTDTGRNIVRSAPSSTLTDTEFDTLMLNALNQYENKQELEASSSYSYSSGYSDGSRSGYNSGYGKGATRGLILGYFIGRR